MTTLSYNIVFCPRFGELAKSYEFVITAARHYWNTVIPLVNEPLERQLLKEPLQVVLHCLAAVTEKNIDKGDEVSVAVSFVHVWLCQGDCQEITGQSTKYCLHF